MDKPPKIPPAELERALSAVGDLLAEAGERVGIVVVGGMAMNLLGFVSRATHDVDVLAVTSPGDDRRGVIRRPTPLHPTFGEIEAAAEWVRTQDPSPGMAQSLRGVVNHARDELA